MKRLLIIAVPLLIISLFLFYSFFGIVVLSPVATEARTTEITKGPLNVWSVYEGRVDARKVVTIMSRSATSATVIELIPDGATVRKGEVLVRFDSSSFEREIIKFERDFSLAASELSGIKNAKLPLELRDQKMELMKTRASLIAEEQYLDATIELAEEGLISAEEIRQQRMKVEEIKAELQTKEQETRLTKEFLHPSELKRMETKLASAAQELKIAKEQLKSSVILAPSDGVVAYRPLHLGTEFRRVRIGDSIYPNQPFMVLPNLNDLVVHCNVPEGEFSKVKEGRDVYIQPLAYPDMQIRGVVETIGSVAEKPPGAAGWQKFFHVVIGLKLTEIDPRLKPGMTVTTHILSYQNSGALLIPRAAVRWENDRPFGTIVTGTREESRPLKLGMASTEHYEVLGGLKAGDKVYIE
ncbi:MAG: efflux RND transporter periplasmic adaptor subunit [Thermodesulfobacteriota bacterium]